MSVFVEDDSGLHCNSCGSNFPTSDADWNWEADDPNALCPSCGSDDISVAE